MLVSSYNRTAPTKYGKSDIWMIFWMTTSSILNSLPTDILILILSKWIDSQGLGVFDSALLNCDLRKIYLKVLAEWVVVKHQVIIQTTTIESERFLHWKINRNAKFENLKIIFLKLPIIGSLFRTVLFSQFRALKSLNLISKLPESWPYSLPSVFDKDVPIEKIWLGEILYGLPNLESLTIRSFNKSILFTNPLQSVIPHQPSKAIAISLKQFRLEYLTCLTKEQSLGMIDHITELVGHSLEIFIIYKCTDISLSHICNQLQPSLYPKLSHFEYVEDGYHRSFSVRHVEHVMIDHPHIRNIIIDTKEPVATCHLDCPSLQTLSLHIHLCTLKDDIPLLTNGSISTWKQLHALSLHIRCPESLSAIMLAVGEFCTSTLQELHLLNAFKLFEETYQSLTYLHQLRELTLVYNITECKLMDSIVNVLCSSSSLQLSLKKLTIQDCRKLTIKNYEMILDAFELEEFHVSINFGSNAFNLSLHEDDIGPMIDRKPLSSYIKPLSEEIQDTILSSDAYDYDYCTIVLKKLVMMIGNDSGPLLTSFATVQKLHIEMIPYKDLRLERNAAFEELNQLPGFHWMRKVPKLQSFKCDGLVFCDEFEASIRACCSKIYHVAIVNSLK